MDVSRKAPCRVYVLDDDNAVCDSVTGFLEDSGFDAHGFRRAETFLESYDGTPGYLLLDIHLDTSDGLAFAQRAVVGRLPLSLVIMTGSIDPEKRWLAHHVGSTAVLQKPFSAEALLAALADAPRPAAVVGSAQMADSTIPDTACPAISLNVTAPSQFAY